MTGVVREVFPDTPVVGISHGTDLRQVKKHPRFKEYLTSVRSLDAYWALGENDKKLMSQIFELPTERITVMGGGFKDTIFTGKR